MTNSNIFTFKKLDMFILWCNYYEMGLHPMYMAGVVARLNSGKPVKMVLSDDHPKAPKREPIPHGI